MPTKEPLGSLNVEFKSMERRTCDGICVMRPSSTNPQRYYCKPVLRAPQTEGNKPTTPPCCRKTAAPCHPGNVVYSPCQESHGCSIDARRARANKVSQSIDPQRLSVPYASAPSHPVRFLADSILLHGNMLSSLFLSVSHRVVGFR